jgi:rhodanese-related sulfurtransferase
MENSNPVTTLLVVLMSIIIIFFLMNNVMHVGFHIGHSHNEHGMDMMSEHGGEHEHDDYDKVSDYEIYPGDVAEKIKNGEDIILLDVRTPEEFEEIHLENALLLPVQKLSQNTLEEIGLGQDAKSKEIVIYCRSGARSKQAYDIMDSLGYTNIKSVAGGIIHWQEDNYPYLETGEYKGSVQSTTKNQSNNSGAQITFDKTIHDFGNVPQSAGVVSTTFEVKNTGDKVLVIGELSTSCTTAKISQSSINPGSSELLTVYFDPNFHDEPSDKITRTVFIPTNDPNQPEVEVKITVDILEGE